MFDVSLGLPHAIFSKLCNPKVKPKMTAFSGVIFSPLKGAVDFIIKAKW